MTSRAVRIAAWTIWAVGAVTLLPGSVGWVLMWTTVWLAVIGTVMFVRRTART